MKKKYRTPKVINMSDEMNNGVPGALIMRPALFLARAVAKAAKGHIDLAAGADAPKTLQIRR